MNNVKLNVEILTEEAGITLKVKINKEIINYINSLLNKKITFSNDTIIVTKKTKELALKELINILHKYNLHGTLKIKDLNKEQEKNYEDMAHYYTEENGIVTKTSKFGFGSITYRKGDWRSACRSLCD